MYSLSQKAEITIESPYFEPRCSVFEDPDDSKRHAFDNMDDDVKPTFSGFHEPGSPSDAPSTSNKSKSRDLSVRAPDREARETPSPSSGNLVTLNFQPYDKPVNAQVSLISGRNK